MIPEPQRAKLGRATARTGKARDLRNQEIRWSQTTRGEPLPNKGGLLLKQTLPMRLVVEPKLRQHPQEACGAVGAASSAGTYRLMKAERLKPVAGITLQRCGHRKCHKNRHSNNFLAGPPW